MAAKTRKRMRPTEVESQLRAAGRVATILAVILIGLVAVVLGAVDHHSQAVTPCPPSECTLHAPSSGGTP